MMEYTLFRRHRPGRCCGEVALYMKQYITMHSSVLGWMMSELRAYRLKQKGRLAQVTLLWMFATGHLIRTRKWTKPSRGSLKGTGPGSYASLKLPRNALEKQHSKD